MTIRRDFFKEHILYFFKTFVSGILLLSLIYIVYTADIDAIKSQLGTIGSSFFLLLFITLVAMLCGTLGWANCITSVNQKIPFYKLFIIRLIGENIAFINPTGFLGGDAYKAYQLQKEGVAWNKASASILISRSIMLISQISLFLLAGLIFMILAGFHYFLFRTILFVALFICVCFFVYSILSRIFKKFDFLKSQIYQGFLLQYKKDLISTKGLILSYLKNDREKFFFACIWCTLNWIIGSFELLLIFSYLGYTVSYFEALLADQGILVLKSFGGFIPGQVGIEEYSNKIMLSFIGLSSASLWISVSVLRRTRQMFWLMISLLCYLFFCLKRPFSIFSIFKKKNNKILERFRI